MLNFGAQNLGSRGGSGPQAPPGSVPVLPNLAFSRISHNNSVKFDVKYMKMSLCISEFILFNHNAFIKYN